MRIKLFDYQTKALEGLPKDTYLAWETGTGKSLAGLEHFNRYNAMGDLVIVAPASKVREKGWEREISRCYENPPKFTVISYDMFRKKWEQIVSSDTTIIFDEAHFLANPTSLRSKASIKASRVAHQFILLSATPSPNGWQSSATYAIMTDFRRNKTDFWTNHVIVDRSRGFPLIMGYRQEKQLEKWWSSWVSPLKRTGDLVLPSQNLAINMPMTATEQKRFKTAIKERVLDDELLDTSGKLFATLRQIPVKSRIEALKTVLDGTGEHVVIFYNFNSERDAILAMLEKSYKDLEVYEQSGHASNLPAREKWQSMKPSVTLAQYQSGSAAIELTYASVTVYFSPTTSYSNYEQSKGRTLRHGQDKTALFYHINVEKSLDKKQYDALRKKKDFSTDLFNITIDNYK